LKAFFQKPGNLFEQVSPHIR